MSDRGELIRNVRTGVIVGVVLGAGVAAGRIIGAVATSRSSARTLAGFTDAFATIAREHAASGPTPADLDAVHRAARAATEEGASGLGAALWAVSRKVADDAGAALDVARDVVQAARQRGG